MNSKTILTTMAVAAAFNSAAFADSVDISFSRITSNSSQNVESQFKVTMMEVAGDSSVVEFVFRNNVGVASSISEIYFDNGSSSPLFTSGSIVEQIGTQFNYGSGSPGNLPGGNSMTESFDVTPGFLADAQGNPSKGLNDNDELVRFRFSLQNAVSYSDVLASLSTTALRIGFHVRAIGEDGNSDSFVNRTPTEGGPMVPLPSPMLLGAAGLGALAGVRRRR